jgi:hypothetical protein
MRGDSSAVFGAGHGLSEATLVPIPVLMNKRGHPETLVAAQPGNANALKQGVHSPRLIQARAAEITSELTQSFAFSPTQRLAVHEASRCKGESLAIS